MLDQNILVPITTAAMKFFREHEDGTVQRLFWFLGQEVYVDKVYVDPSMCFQLNRPLLFISQFKFW